MTNLTLELEELWGNYTALQKSMQQSIDAAGYSMDIIWVILCAVFVFFMQVRFVKFCKHLNFLTTNQLQLFLFRFRVF